MPVPRLYLLSVLSDDARTNRWSRRKFVSGLAKCIEIDALLTICERSDWLENIRAGQRLFCAEREEAMRSSADDHLSRRLCNTVLIMCTFCLRCGHTTTGE